MRGRRRGRRTGEGEGEGGREVGREGLGEGEGGGGKEGRKGKGIGEIYEEKQLAEFQSSFKSLYQMFVCLLWHAIGGLWAWTNVDNL